MNTPQSPRPSRTKSNYSLGVYAGPQAVANFLNPDNIPPTPLVEIPDYLNPYREDGVRIFAKLMNMLPLGNVKSLPAYQMLESLNESGELEGVTELVESSSGNTVASLAIIAHHYGIEKTRALVSSEVTEGKLELLRLLGVEVEVTAEPICPDPGDPQSGIYRAQAEAKTNLQIINPGQYHNKANPAAHERWTGPQLWTQTGGDITIFTAGLGTTGSLYGTGTYLKQQNSNIYIVGVARSPNNPVPGVRTENLLRQVAFDWQKHLDSLVSIGTTTAFKHSLELCRSGLMVGPSAGFALAGLIDEVGRLKQSGKLDSYRNDASNVIAVFLAPDGPLPYLHDYFQYLDDSDFPAITGRELLKDQPSGRIDNSVPVSSVRELEPAVAYSLGYGSDQAETSNTDERIKPYVIDVRSPQEYADHHLAGSINIPLDDYLRDPTRHHLKHDGLTLFVCAHGVRSSQAAAAATAVGLSAASLTGGTAAWSAAGLPRVKPAQCAPVTNHPTS